MIRVIFFLATILALATGLSWLADQPGNVRVEGQGWVLETSLFRAVVLATLAVGTALVSWSLIRPMWHSPAAVGNAMNRRRNRQGMQALSSGMIAVGAGDRAGATRHALLARKAMPNEPMTQLLRAQAAQLAGDKSTARRIFDNMLASPDTEPLGLRGLFLEAEREKETEAARQYAARALKLNPKLLWASDALFDIQCRSRDWSSALDTLATARKNGLIDKPIADRRRAVLLTAQAAKAEDHEPDRALNLAIEAHNLAPNLVPAAAQAARMLASRGNTPKAAKIAERAWARSPHPDLATVYAYARVGDSPRDRLTRIKRLAAQNPNSSESAIAVANAAIDAREFDEAREALAPMLDSKLTQRIATLMARIESEQFGDKGRVREWLARAVNAPRDPAWTADGIVSEDWSPISPVTGQLDAVQWKVPVEQLASRDGDLLARRVEELVALGAPAPIEASAAVDAEMIEAEPLTSRFTAASSASYAPTGRPASVGGSTTGSTTGPSVTPSATTSQAIAQTPLAPEKPASRDLSHTPAGTKPAASTTGPAPQTSSASIAASPARASSIPASSPPVAASGSRPASAPVSSNTVSSNAVSSDAVSSPAATSASAQSAAMVGSAAAAAASRGSVKPSASSSASTTTVPSDGNRPASSARTSSNSAANATTSTSGRNATVTLAPSANDSSTAPSNEASSLTGQISPRLVPTSAKSDTSASSASSLSSAKATSPEPLGAKSSQQSASVQPAVTAQSSAQTTAAKNPTAGADANLLDRASSGEPAASQTAHRVDPAAKRNPAQSATPAANVNPSPKEPRIFVVPHAPDDPGPEGSDDVLPKGNRPPYRALP